MLQRVIAAGGIVNGEGIQVEEDLTQLLPLTRYVVQVFVTQTARLPHVPGVQGRKCRDVTA